MSTEPLDPPPQEAAPTPAAPPQPDSPSPAPGSLSPLAIGVILLGACFGVALIAALVGLVAIAASDGNLFGAGLDRSARSQEDEADQPEETEEAEETEAPRADRFDVTGNAIYGQFEVGNRFADPLTVPVTAGGNIDAAYLGGGCFGFAPSSPQVSLDWSGQGDLRIFFEDDGAADTVLMVSDARDEWRCNDDGGYSYDPMIDLDNPPAGRIGIWVGTYSAGIPVNGTLTITQDTSLHPTDPGPPTELPQQGSLDVGGNPTYGLLELDSQFSDPLIVPLSAGGNVDASYLGSGCFGYVPSSPLVSLDWSGQGDLRIFFNDNGMEDTVLLVVDARGEWRCNDDGGFGLDPMVDLRNPPSGRLDIWVGTYFPGTSINGSLTITQDTSLHPIDPTPTPPPGGGLDVGGNPSEASLELEDGFDDPLTVPVTAGGTVDAGYLSGGCFGYAPRSPHVSIDWTGQRDLRIFFQDNGTSDTVLLIHGADDQWYCDDDSDYSYDPMIDLDNPPAGRIDIWVGSYQPDQSIDGTLTITQDTSLHPEDPQHDNEGQSLDLTGSPTEAYLQLNDNFRDPSTVPVTAGGDVDASYLPGPCFGYAPVFPQVSIDWSGQSDLRIFFQDEGAADTVILIHGADDQWYCNDDGGFSYDPMVDLDNPPAGRIDIWVGSYQPDYQIDGTLTITQDMSLHPSDPGGVPPQGGGLEVLGDPMFGLLDLSDSFSDPVTVSMTGGGDIDSTYLPYSCFGYTISSPQVSIDWTGQGDLRIFFVPEDAANTLLLVHDALDEWHCDDDSDDTLDPLVHLDNPRAGRIDIWVAAFSPNTYIDGTLYITQDTSLNPGNAGQ